MDKYQATKTLTEKLVESHGRMVIFDEVYKKKLLKEAEHAYIVDNSLDIFIERDCPKITYARRIGDKYTGSQKIEEVVDKLVPATANYVFLSDKTHLSEYKCLISLTPYAIIGSKEVEAIKRLFYKTYDANIREAISSLGIKDFFELYHTYRYNNERFQSLFCNDFENFKAETLEFLHSRTYDSSNETKLDAFEARFRIDKFNSRLREFGVKFILPTTKQAAWIKKHEIDLLADMLKNHVPPIDKDPLNIEFLRFVFEIPYEDRNLELNKSMFKDFGKFLDVDLIVIKEYSSGKYFKEYFDLLDEKKQRDIVHIVKQSSVQNNDYNHFLWMKGSEDIRLDYLKLYREDAESFINYFTSRRVEERKVILKDLMECDFINDKVTEWLNENESDLIREVGLSDG